MSSYDEPFEQLTGDVRAGHRAMQSLIEEIGAVDAYNQRASLTQERELQAILTHNRDEEIEHAAMLLEWLRRNMPGWDKELRDWLFTDKPIAHP